MTRSCAPAIRAIIRGTLVVDTWGPPGGSHAKRMSSTPRLRRPYPRVQRSPAGDLHVTRSLSPLESYTCKADHRNKTNKNKTLWRITEADEIECFEESIAKNWNAPKARNRMGWGVILDPSNKPSVVGVAPPDYRRELIFARFDEGNPAAWHGCPADYLARIQDTPSKDVLMAWVGLRYRYLIQRV